MNRLVDDRNNMLLGELLYVIQLDVSCTCIFIFLCFMKWPIKYQVMLDNIFNIHALFPPPKQIFISDDEPEHYRRGRRATFKQCISSALTQ